MGRGQSVSPNSDLAAFKTLIYKENLKRRVSIKESEWLIKKWNEIFAEIKKNYTCNTEVFFPPEEPFNNWKFSRNVFKRASASRDLINPDAWSRYPETEYGLYGRLATVSPYIKIDRTCYKRV